MNGKEERTVIIGEACLRFWPIERLGWAPHCFTTRRFHEGGVEGEGSRLEMSAKLRSTFFPSASAVVWGEQVHGRGVGRADDPRAEFTEIPGVDSVVCSTPGICIVAFGADCPIVFLLDIRRRVIALSHAGRRGAGKRAVTACVRELKNEFGSSPADCLAVVSPSIGPCCYPVDLWRNVTRELEEAGVGELLSPGICTSCHKAKFFSYRREKGRCGRMLAALMIKN